MIDVRTATTTELVAFYNKHADKQVKKFQDRATAERRVSELLIAMEIVEATKPSLHPISTAIVAEVGRKGNSAAKNNEEVRKSWELDHVRAARTTRHGVTVTESRVDFEANHGPYKSTFKAFVALGLPLNKHTTFRAELKKEGKATIGDFTFSLVER